MDINYSTFRAQKTKIKLKIKIYS